MSVFALGMMDLIGTLERLVDPLHYRRDAVRRIKTLVGIHLSGEIGVGRNLPAAEIDRLQPGLYLLDSLIAGQRAKGRDIVFGVQKPPKFLRPTPGQSLFHEQRSLAAARRPANE